MSLAHAPGESTTRHTATPTEMVTASYVHLGLDARADTLPDFACSEESLTRYEAATLNVVGERNDSFHGQLLFRS
jgi:hypothetical protein